MINDHDQMQKGPRFVWFNWTQRLSVKLTEENGITVFEGKIAAFQHLNKKITHQRTVRKSINLMQWEVTDVVSPEIDLPIRQFWHPHPEWIERIEISAIDQEGKVLDLHESQGWYSSSYGEKDEVPEWFYETSRCLIRTIISIKELI